MSDISVLIIVAIAGIILALVIAGLMLGPGEPAHEPSEVVHAPESAVSGFGPGRDRRAGGPAFRAAALVAAHRPASVSAARRRRKLAQQARLTGAVESAHATDLTDETTDRSNAA